MKRALLFGGVSVIAGIALIVMWAVSDQAASRGNDWTQVIATIESAHPQEGGLHISYRYEYASGQHRNPEGHLTIPEGARPGSITARYAAGRQVLAYVNPSAPAESISSSGPAVADQHDRRRRPPDHRPPHRRLPPPPETRRPRENNNHKKRARKPSKPSRASSPRPPPTEVSYNPPS
jgi:hypothetical protein